MLSSGLSQREDERLLASWAGLEEEEGVAGRLAPRMEPPWGLSL